MKDRAVCQKMEQRSSELRNGHPCLRKLCSALHFRNGWGRSTSQRNDFGKSTIQNSRFNHSHGDVYQKRSHLCTRRSVSHNSIFLLCIGLVLSQLHKTLLWDINKFVYSCVLVPCRLAEEDKIDVSKLLFLIWYCLKNMEVNDLQSHTYCMLGTQHALRYFCWSS